MRGTRVRAGVAAALSSLLMIGVVSAPPASAAAGPVVSLGDSSGLERDLVTGSVFVPVLLSAPAAAPVTVSFSTTAGTATSGVDYTRWGTPAAPRTVTIPTGSVQATINVPVLTDDVVEPDESFSVVVASVSGAEATIGDGTGVATIVDADGIAGSNPAITVSSGTVVEGDAGQRRAQFQVHLSRPPASNVTITYATADGSAVSPTDYTAKVPGTVVFAAGQISKTIDVSVNSNTAADGDRSLSLDVSVTGGSPVEELDLSGTSTIVDDDPVPVPCAPGTYSASGAEPCSPAPAGYFVAAAGAAAATPCAAGYYQPSTGRTSCLVAHIGSYVPVTAATDTTPCPDGTTTVVEAATSLSDCVPFPDRTPPVLDVPDAVSLDAPTLGGVVLGGGSYAASAVDAVDGEVPVECTPGPGDTVALGDTVVTCTAVDLSGNQASATFTITVTYVGPPPATEVSVGPMSACAVLPAGVVRCWGNNDGGQLGDGTLVDRSTPVAVSGLTGVTQVASGEPAGSFGAWTTCARRSDATAWCWGSDGTGAVGNGTASGSTRTPQRVTGLSGVEQVSVGNIHACARTDVGSVWCWGWGIGGKLGDGDTSNHVQQSPVAVVGLTDVVDLDAGSFHTCAVRSDGTVWCWGSNSSGQLGTGGTGDSALPVQVVGITDAVEVSSGYSHACARRSSGAMWCWGSNGSGQLGRVGGSSRVPVAVTAMASAVQISAGYGSTCAVRSDHTVACWGANSNGALGFSSGGAIVPTPVVVPGLSGVTQVSVNGQNHFGTTGPVLGQRDIACFVTPVAVRCSGSNEFGQLGDGSTVDSPTPVVVGGL